MPPTSRPIIAATRGSPLALAQTRQVLADCRAAFPDLEFEFRIIKTTGDKLQKASMAQPDASLPKGLFTKELEVALLEGSADLAIHSLKDLPTELPDGLELGGVPLRADPRDVLIYRSEIGAAWQPTEPPARSAEPIPSRRWFAPGLTLDGLPDGVTIATSSTRRREQLLAARPHARVVEIRGNVGTRLRKLLEQPDLDGLFLAGAGLARLGYRIREDGSLALDANPGDEVAPRWHEEREFHASFLPVEQMLPCVGQAALGLEVRQGDERLARVCARLTHPPSHSCVTAERAFLAAMGGGCQSPVAAYAQCEALQLHLRAVSFRDGPAKAAELRGPLEAPETLGKQMAERLR